MDKFNKSFIDVFDKWEVGGINIGTAIRKQINEGLKWVNIDGGKDEQGMIVINEKPHCPDCGATSYTGNFCSNCGKRLRNEKKNIHTGKL